MPGKRGEGIARSSEQELDGRPVLGTGEYRSVITGHRVT